MTVTDLRTLTDAKRAKIELARRELARRRLIEFCCYVDPDAAIEGAIDPYVQNHYRAAHLQLMASYIEQAEADTLWDNVPGTGKKVLLITTPPGHWKSSLISRKLPAWFIGKRHRAKRPHQTILTSYNSALAQMNNARVLELIQTHRYQNIFPLSLSRKSQSSEEWALAGVPFTSCVARGVGGGLTGYHAAMAIVDDPIKDRRDANSPTIRQNLWDWWRDVLRTRLLNESSFILGVWTRWTEDDPAGRIFQEQTEGISDERVVLLRLPALAETESERQSAAKLGLPVDPADPLGRQPGEALWPEKESRAAHLATQKAYPLTFDSLYQGRPRPAGGYIVGENQFKTLPSLPSKNVRYVWGTDWAITEKQVAPSKKDPDYTVIALVGLWTPSPDDARLVIGYIERGRLNQFDAREMVTNAIINHEKRYPMRSGQANMDKTYLNTMRRDPRLLRYSIKNLSRTELNGDKVTKATPWLEMVQAGQVYVVQGAWNSDFFAEVENFPNGAHDDQIDAISVAIHAIGIANKSKKVSSKKMNFYG